MKHTSTADPSLRGWTVGIMVFVLLCGLTGQALAEDTGSTPATVSDFILMGNVTGSTDYVSQTQDNSVVKATITLSDDQSSELRIQFSNDGSNWGIYDGSTNNTTGGSTWTAGTYVAVTGITTTPTATTVDNSGTGVWQLSGTGPKTVYVRVSDEGDNVSPATVPGGYTYKKEITFDTTSSGADVSTSQSYFPVCVHINSSSWAAADRTAFFSTSNSGGKRIRFYDSDETTTLSYEVEYYDDTSEEAVFWVKVPQVAGNSNTDKIVVAYGNDPYSSDQDDSTGVWDNDFVGVFHLTETSGDFQDSSSLGNHGTDNVTSSTKAGYVSDGQDFNGTGDNICLNDVYADLALATNGKATVSAWINRDFADTDSTYRAVFGCKYDSSNYWRIFYHVGSDYWAYSYACSGNYKGGNFPKGHIPQNTWKHFVWSIDESGADTSDIYLDGSYLEGVSGVGNWANNSGNMYWGSSDTGGAYHWDGQFDEMRISKRARSEDWIKLEYFSMKKSNWNGDGWISWGNEITQESDITDTITVAVYTISGSVGILDGVTMSGLPGDPVTSGGGLYSTMVDHGWSGTVSPTKLGYTFDPENRVYSNVTSDQENQDYTPIETSLTISGCVGTLDGVTLSGLPGDPVTSGGGLYSATVGHGWSGTVTPTKAGYRFDPIDQTYSNVTSDQTNQDYTPTAVHTISGSVGTLDGVTLSGLPGDPVTSGGGLYSATVDTSWSGTVTPTKAGYRFDPVNQTYSNVTSDQTNQDYTPTATYTISGSVGDLDGVTLSGLPGSPVTSGGGSYSVTVDHGWSGTVTPTKIGHTFDPENRVYANVASDQLDQDYAITTTYTISGSVGSLDGVTLSGLPGDPETSSGGLYSATVGYNWSGTVTPTKVGYTFDPADRAYSGITADQLDQDYTPIETTHTISGSVGTLDGVTMSGLPSNPETSGGFYSATVGHGWSGTVTPTKTGHTFDPENREYANVTSDHTNQDYTPSMTTCFTIPGSNTFTVPPGIYSITVKVWGGGGGGANYYTFDQGDLGDGGGAGFAQATIPVTPGETLDVHVGGGGGAGYAVWNCAGGGGGGYSGMLRGSAPLIIAGGGGGGGTLAFESGGGPGGVGGGTAGGDGSGDLGGGGGSQSSGGSAGYSNATPGSSLTGGDGGDTCGKGGPGGVNGGGDGGCTTASGGGGGAGYYGGGGGGGSGGTAAGGGGGGSSYTTGSNTSTESGSGRDAGNSDDPDYADNAGYGGAGGVGALDTTAGNPGRVVVKHAPGHLISGSVGTLDGVTMSGLPGDPVVTSGGGFYSAAVPDAWSGTVTPSITGFTFAPANRQYSDVTSDQTNQDYTPIPLYTISGSVGDLDGVTMSGLPGNPATSSGGFYSALVEEGWSGTVTPTKAGYTFDPESRQYANVTSDRVNEDYAITTTYTISGSIGTVAGVTLSGLPGNPVTSGDGSYSATVVYGWSGTVTPSKVGFTFEPGNLVYSNVTSNQENQDYSPIVTTHGIYGSVTTIEWPPGSEVPLDGVTLSGLPGNPVISGGSYSATVGHGWSGTVTPIKEGYTFDPANRVYTSVTSDQEGQDYFAPQTFTISGSVGTLDGVTMSGLPGNPVTAGGFYSGTVDAQWDGTVTPTKEGFRFDPTHRVYTNVTSDQEDQSYTPTVIHTVSGSVSTLDGVTLSGLPGNPVTSGGGFYSVTVDDGWSGTVTPTKEGHTFSPANRVYDPVTSDQTNQDYTPIYTISGLVGTLDGVTMSGLPGNPMTSGGGFYSATVDHGWSGTVTPIKEGHTFSPVNRVYDPVTSDQTNQDYAITTTYSISGTVYTDTGTTSIGADKTVRLKINGAGDYTDETDTNGAYSITEVAASSGDIITVFLDDETEKAVTVTRYTGYAGGDLTGLDLYQNRVIVRHEDAGPITNADLGQYDKDDDTDIHFTSNSSTLTLDNDHGLHIWTGDSFSAGEVVSTLPGGAPPGGDVHIDNGATFIGPDVVTWTEATSSAGWSGRNGHTSVVYDNKLWVIGGSGGLPFKSDVWHSIDGINWTRATSGAGWSNRYQHTSVVYDNKMWVIGGWGDSGGFWDALNDVWYSTDGVNWTEATSSANWSARNGHASVVYDNKMWVLGGRWNNDVWYSTDGVNWTEATSAAPWSARHYLRSVVYDNKMWVIGGSGKNDVWYSTDGANWTEATSSANWSGRENHVSVVYDNKMWVLGGNDGSDKNDVWYSIDGVDWTEAASAADWSARSGHTSVAYDGKLWVLGGGDNNDAWCRGTGSMTVGGNWSDSGAFIHNNCTVTFNGTTAQQVTTGASEWNNVVITNSSVEGVTFTDGFTCAAFTDVTAGSTLYFPSGQTATITASGGLTLTGAPADLITLRRYGGVHPDQWNIDPQGGSWSVTYVDVKDSNNSRATYINPSNSQDTGNNTNWFTQVPFPLTSFVVEAPASGTAGTAFTVTITAKDPDGNTTTNVLGDTALSVDAGTISPTSIAEADFTDDGIWTGNVTLSQAGSRTITATNDGMTGQDTVTIGATTGALAGFTVDAPASGTVDTAFSLTISANNSEGNTTTDVLGDTTLSVDAGTISPMTIAQAEFTDDGIWTGNVTLSQIGSRTITATNSGMTGEDTITINIGSGALAGFTVDAPASGTVDTAFSVTIIAKDSGGNTTTTVSGATALLVDVGNISPTSIAEAEFTDDGIWTGNVTLSQPGSRTITATNSGMTGEDTITINATTGVLAGFTVDAPDSSIAGTAFGVTIVAEDSGGSATSNVSGDTILSVDSGTISPTSIAEADFTDDGIWTGNVTLSQPGSRTITATNDGKAGEDTIVIHAGALDSFTVDAPDTGTVGDSLTVTITATDAEGNTTTDVSGDVTLSVDAGSISPISLAQSEFTDDGIWTGEVTLCAPAGSRTITARTSGGSLIDESFETPGYEESWTEVKDYGFDIVDDAAIPGSAPWGAGSHSMTWDWTLGHDPLEDHQVYAYRAETNQVAYIRFYFYVDCEGLNAGDTTVIQGLYTADGDGVARVRMVDWSGVDEPKIGFVYWDGDTISNPTTDIALDRWYRIEYKYDGANNQWAFRLYDDNDALLRDSSGTLSNARTPGTFVYGLLNHSGPGLTQVYYDLLAWDTSDWVGQGSFTGQDTITMNAGALESFAVDAPDSANADTTFSVTITAKDCGGNISTNVSGDTTLSVDAGTISPTSIAEAEFTDDGIWTGSVMLSQGGSRTIVSTNNGKTGQDTITIGYILTMVVSGGGSTSPAAGDSVYVPGEAVNISATPGACEEFAYWSGDVGDPDSVSTTVVMDGNKTVTAYFTWLEACQFHHAEECTVCHASEKTGATSNLDVIAELIDTSRLIDGADSGNGEVIFTSYTGNNSFADGDGVIDGICEVCHTDTIYHRNDGSGLSHYPGEDCAPCHAHCDEFMHGGGEPNCFTAGCHAVNLMHAAHFENDPPGLPPDETGCNVCHADGHQQCEDAPVMADHQYFPYTNVCSACHSMP